MVKIKKSYNPFKMWGTWLGGLIGFLYLVIISNLLPAENYLIKFINFFNISDSLTTFGTTMIIFISAHILLGMVFGASFNLLKNYHINNYKTKNYTILYVIILNIMLIIVMLFILFGVLIENDYVEKNIIVDASVDGMFSCFDDYGNLKDECDWKVGDSIPESGDLKWHDWYYSEFKSNLEDGMIA